MKMKLKIFLLALACVVIPLRGNVRLRKDNKEKNSTKIHQCTLITGSLNSRAYINPTFNFRQTCCKPCFKGEFTIANINTDDTENNVSDDVYVRTFSITNDLEEDIYMFTNTTVNLRESANTNSKRINTLSPNICVRVVEKGSEWDYVVVDEDLYGYIKNEYLSENETDTKGLNRWNIDLNDDEIELLAKILWLESRGESQQGKECVVEVIFNRMISDKFGGSLYEVLSSKRQFSTWRMRYKANPTSDEFNVIYDVLEGRSNHLAKDYVYFSTKRVNGKGFIKIGNHWFSK